MQPERNAKAMPTSEDIAFHLPLVERIVAHFMRRLPRSVQREDLMAAGMLGLFHALRWSAHTCPEMFASYARIRIRGSIVDELRRHDWSPRRRKEPAANSNGNANANAANGNGSGDAKDSPSNVTSIAPPASGAVPVLPRVTIVAFDDLWAGAAAGFAEESASPLENMLERRKHEALHAAVAALPEREREIVSMRYFQGMTSKGIARVMGLSEARISQLHARAMKLLRDVLGDSAEEMKLAA
jgi:RNA polymerase sigma factor for flagellar operon FliA